MPIAQVISKGHIPVKIWTPDMESGAMDQATNLANLPFAFKHIAVMPDTHQGYGMPIGGVLATKDVIVPNAVGVDIGCGMIAVQTGLQAHHVSREQLDAVVDDIYAQIPTGRHWHSQPLPGHESRMWYDYAKEQRKLGPISSAQFDRSRIQLGTLGGGNHFIEIQAEEGPEGQLGQVWIMIHSGSRNLGKQICDHYNKVAKELNAKWQTAVPPSWQLAFLPIDTEEGQAYITEMNAALEFAKWNREAMLTICKNIMRTRLGLSSSQFLVQINAHHNYAALEHHFGQNVWVHRKGAIRARAEEIGIIPGSMGTASYIVEGLGNPDSFMSASHGSGRMMSRTAAKQAISTEQMAETMGNVVYRSTDTSEAPGAYKDIEDVMRFQNDLVIPVWKLRPLAVIKGEE